MCMKVPARCGALFSGCFDPQKAWMFLQMGAACCLRCSSQWKLCAERRLGRMKQISSELHLQVTSLRGSLGSFNLPPGLGLDMRLFVRGTKCQRRAQTL
ncbi:hypothetical protein PBY51_011322 [Eleginops maclovinus]|uniref:Uncharacterized protein n=1 Tax=Eleginops maclovinus TaxID=56733 RepID=A0AAN8ASA4_ELEMC|nr:hypothetical protein PBY51_011322 [Eleginops maclovinus]